MSYDVATIIAEAYEARQASITAAVTEAFAPTLPVPEQVAVTAEFTLPPTLIEDSYYEYGLIITRVRVSRITFADGDDPLVDVDGYGKAATKAGKPSARGIATWHGLPARLAGPLTAHLRLFEETP